MKSKTLYPSRYRSSSKQMSMPTVSYDTIHCVGGLDQLTPSLSLNTGAVRDGRNFECAPTLNQQRQPTGGYTRTGGYERYNGEASPSDASYQVIQVTSFTNVPTVGQTLTGFSSSATGQIIAVVEASLYVVLTKIVGAFTSVEVVKVGATTIGTATSTTVSVTALLNAQYKNLAADVYRALIDAVPGSGEVRGVIGATFSGVDCVYAFRDNAAGTACDLYQASASGWTQITLYNEISFTLGGTGTPADGATLTEGGVTATIKRVMLQSGSWAAGTAAGRFIVTNPAGGDFSAGAATAGAVGVTLSAIQTAITITAGGEYEFDVVNFFGQAGTKRIYGADNTNRGFEFDGTTYAPITTGTTNDHPKYVKAHKTHLFWAFESSAIHSGPGLPYTYTALSGGSEIATGDLIAGFQILPGMQTTAAMAIYGSETTHILYGTTAATWSLVPFNSGIGALDHTAQNLAQSYILDNVGLSSLQTSQSYGNFAQSYLTHNIQTFINSKRSLVSCSTVSRAKSQYRLFFTDASALYVTIVNGKLLGSMPQYFADAFSCVWNRRTSTGAEVTYAGAATGGYVFELDQGSSFDGADIDAYITLNWNAVRSPQTLKDFLHASLEIDGNFYAAISFGYELGYATTTLTQQTPVNYATGFSGAPVWDTFVWDSFTWDGVTLFPTEVDMTGTAENYRITIRSGTDYIYPFTVNTIIAHYIPRRGKR
ncbi:MAG: hypothetical protein Q7R68_10995 [Nitrospirales bacterium]|nr:hypothetical protein [Nitrospirales bacterium]